MADPTTARTIPSRPNAGKDAYPIANGVTLFEGALVGLVAGYLDFWDDGANSVFAGICEGAGVGIDPNSGALTGDTSATPVPEARVDESGAILVVTDLGGTPSQAKVGDLVYSADGNLSSLTLTIGALNHPIGFLKKFRSTTDVDVQLFTPAEFLAQATA